MNYWLFLKTNTLFTNNNPGNPKTFWVKRGHKMGYHSSKSK